MSFRNLLLAYARFLFLPTIQILTVVSIFVGGAWLWAGLIAYCMLTLVADEFSGETEIVEPKQSSFFHDMCLYIAVVLMVIEMLLLAWFLGDGDLLLIGLMLDQFGIELFAARSSSSLVHIAGLIFSVGFTLAGVAGAGGHELMHRTRSRFDFFMGQLAMSLSAYSSFMFEHVYGHHRNVGFLCDSGTAQRGTSLWSHIFRSIKLCHINAFRYERNRLVKKEKAWLHYSNRVLQGHAMALLTLTVFIWSGGLYGFLGFAVTVWLSISLTEAYSYLGHYGLIRAPGKPIEPRHSWNSYNGLLSGLLFNLPRHSNHHRSVNKSYWQLEKEMEAPVMPMSISLMATIAMIPPLFYKSMEQSLNHWDRHFASKEELDILSESFQ